MTRMRPFRVPLPPKKPAFLQRLDRAAAAAASAARKAPDGAAKRFAATKGTGASVAPFAAATRRRSSALPLGSRALRQSAAGRRSAVGRSPSLAWTVGGAGGEHLEDIAAAAAAATAEAAGEMAHAAAEVKSTRP